MTRALTQRMIGFTKYYPIYEGEKGAGKKAAIKAGFSAKSASRTACELLKRQDIRERVEVEKKILADKVEMESSEIIKRYQDMAKIQGDYTKATVADAERALKQLGKYKNMPGFAEKVIIEEREPFDDWKLEELIEYKTTGKVPQGKKLPNIKASRGFISRILSEESGENLN